MTALSEYQRLECTGLWREAPGRQRREVVISFGDASLTLRDGRSERALSHWSLPAVRRLNPGSMPALFAPGPDSSEELEIDDDMMVAALGKVQTIIQRRRPHPGRLRGVLLTGMGALVLGVAVFWMPGAIIKHTASVLPPATESAIGAAILADLGRLTGQPCDAPEGQAVLTQLGDRLLESGAGALFVLPEGLKGSILLPGGSVALGRPLLEDHETPEVAAGYVLAEEVGSRAHDPVLDALDFAGMTTAIRLLTSGEVPDGAFRGYGERLLARQARPVPAGALLLRFEQAGVSARPYAEAAAGDGAPDPALVNGDPFPPGTPVPRPLMTDTDWVALQGICLG